MHIYFSGVGGVGIGPLALLARDCGYLVSGSDLYESEMTNTLTSQGLRISIGQDGSQIATEHTSSPIDWFVYSSALPKDHPELVFAQQNNIKISKRSEFLNHVLKEKKLRLLAVSGTHGKTTTTGMLIWLFQQLKVPVSYSIGTTVPFGPPAQYQTGSEYFIYECDEFDRNFLDFKPYLSIIPSVDYDHADIYPTQADYDYAFLDFIAESQRCLLWQESADHLQLTDTANVSILSPNDPGKQSIRLAGEHMRRNAWLAVQAVHEIFLQTEPAQLAARIGSFPGTNRRFEKLATNLYTDYAHHPVEIAAVIEMAKEINPNVVVIYQPHQNIRQHEILKENGYQKCFESAKITYWLPTYLSRENQNLPTLSSTDLIATTSANTKTQYIEMGTELLAKIKEHQNAGDLVVAMSAGDLDHWLREALSSASDKI